MTSIDASMEHYTGCIVVRQPSAKRQMVATYGARSWVSSCKAPSYADA